MEGGSWKIISQRNEKSKVFLNKRLGADKGTSWTIAKEGPGAMGMKHKESVLDDTTKGADDKVQVKTSVESRISFLRKTLWTRAKLCNKGEKRGFWGW